MCAPKLVHIPFFSISAPDNHGSKPFSTCASTHFLLEPQAVPLHSRRGSAGLWTHWPLQIPGGGASGRSQQLRSFRVPPLGSSSAATWGGVLHTLRMPTPRKLPRSRHNISFVYMLIPLMYALPRQSAALRCMLPWQHREQKTAVKSHSPFQRSEQLSLVELPLNCTRAEEAQICACDP